MNLKEISVARITDLKDGEMKPVSIGDGNEILLIKKIFAVSTGLTMNPLCP